MAAEAVTVAITGASGAIYGLRLIRVLAGAGHPLFVLISDTARLVINTETDWHLPESLDGQRAALAEHLGEASDNVQLLGPMDWWTPVVSGGGAPRCMVVCPCSMSTLSALACGASNNLIQRAADVALKERHQLILVPREMPLSSLHLENMLKLSQWGTTIMPAAPGLYHNPAGLNEIIDFVVDRILRHLGTDIQLLPVWA